MMKYFKLLLFLFTGYFRDSRSSCSTGDDSVFFVGPSISYPVTSGPDNPTTSYTGQGVASQPRDRQTSEFSATKHSNSEKATQNTVKRAAVIVRKHRSKSSDNVAYERKVDCVPPLSFDSTASYADLKFSYKGTRKSRFSAPVHRASRGYLKHKGAKTDRENSFGDKSSGAGSDQRNNVLFSKYVTGRSVAQILVTRTDSVNKRERLHITQPGDSNSLPKRETLDSMEAASCGSTKSPPPKGQSALRSQRSRDHKLEKSSSITSERSTSSPYSRESFVSTPTSDSQPMTYGEARSTSRLRSENYMKYLSASKTSLNTSRTNLSTNRSSRESINSVTDQVSPVPHSPSAYRRPNIRTSGKPQILDDPDSYKELEELNASMKRVDNDGKWYKPTGPKHTGLPVAKVQEKLPKKIGSNFASLPNRKTTSPPSANPVPSSSPISCDLSSKPAANSQPLMDDSNALVHSAMIHQEPSPKTSSASGFAGGKTAHSISTNNGVLSPTNHSQPLQDRDHLHATLPLHDNPLAMSRERERSAAVAASILLGVKLSPSENDLLSRLAMEENPQAGYLRRKMRDENIPPKKEKCRDRPERYKGKKKSKESVSSGKKYKESVSSEKKSKESVSSERTHKRNKSKERSSKNSPMVEKPVKNEGVKTLPNPYLDTSDSGRSSRSGKLKTLFRQDSDTSTGKPSKREKISGFIGSVIDKGKKAFRKDLKKSKNKSHDNVLSSNVSKESSPKIRASPRVQHTGVQTLPETPDSFEYEPRNHHPEGLSSVTVTPSKRNSLGTPQSHRQKVFERSDVSLPRANEGIRTIASSMNPVRSPASTGNSPQEIRSSSSAKLPKAAARRHFFASMKSSSLGKEPTINKEDQSSVSPTSSNISSPGSTTLPHISLNISSKHGPVENEGKDMVPFRNPYSKPTSASESVNLDHALRQSDYRPERDKENKHANLTGKRYFETETGRVGAPIISTSNDQQPMFGIELPIQPIKKELQGNKPYSIKPLGGSSKNHKDEILLNYYKRETSRQGVGGHSLGSTSTCLNGQTKSPENKASKVTRYFNKQIDMEGEIVMTVCTEKSPGGKKIKKVPGTKVMQGARHNNTNKNKDIIISTKGDKDNNTTVRVSDQNTHLIKSERISGDTNLTSNDYKDYGAVVGSIPASTNRHNLQSNCMKNSEPLRRSKPTEAEKWYDEILQKEKGILNRQATEESETTVSEVSELEYYDSSRETPLKSPDNMAKEHMRITKGHQLRIFSTDSGSESSYASAENVKDSSLIEEQSKLLSALQNAKFAEQNKRAKRKMNKAQSFDSVDIDSFVTNVVEQEHTRLFREKHMEKKHSSDTDEGIGKDKMDKLKKPLNVDMKEAKLQDTLSSPGDSALGTPSSSIVSNMKVDETALDDIQYELAQVIRNENNECGDSQTHSITSDRDVKGEIIRDSFLVHSTHSPPLSNEGKEGRNMENLDQDTYLMYSIFDTNAIDKADARTVLEKDKNYITTPQDDSPTDDLAGFECIPENHKNVPHMEYVSKLSISLPNNVIRMSEDSSGFPVNDRLSLSPVNELSEYGISSESSAGSRDNDKENISQQKELSSVESPSQRQEGDRVNYYTYDIVEESAMTSMDGVVMGAILTNKAKNKFLKIPNPKPIPYEPIFNRHAHPYKNFGNEDGDTNTKKTQSEVEEPHAEDPEDQSYEPTNMLRELVLLKSAGFDQNDDKLNDFDGLKMELDENKKRDGGNEEVETENADNENTKIEGQTDEVTDLNDNFQLENTVESSPCTLNIDEANKETETLDVPPIKKKTNKKKEEKFNWDIAEKSRRSSTSSSNTSELDLECHSPLGNKDKEAKRENVDISNEKQYPTCVQKSNDSKSGASNDSTNLPEENKSSFDTVVEESPEDIEGLSAIPRGSHQKIHPETRENCDNNSETNTECLKAKIERHVSFSEKPSVVFELDSVGTQTDGSSDESANKKKEEEASNDDTDEPVFVISSFDTFLQQVYVNMGMFLLRLYVSCRFLH